MNDKQLARVESTHLGFEDHGVYSVNVAFTGAGWGQGTGHYAITQRGEDGEQHAANGWGVEFIVRMLQACSCSRWEDLPGSVVWIIREAGRIVGVEPLEINKGKPFRFDEIEEAKAAR
jgi:hypothetical protein